MRLVKKKAQNRHKLRWELIINLSENFFLSSHSRQQLLLFLASVLSSDKDASCADVSRKQPLSTTILTVDIRNKSDYL
jgi:hypothetical protein